MQLAVGSARLMAAIGSGAARAFAASAFCPATCALPAGVEQVATRRIMI
jgi:hypothetical protein